MAALTERRQTILELRMASITEDPVPAVLTSAKVHLPTVLGGVRLGTHPASLVRSVTKGLVLAQAAGTPIVGLSSFDFDHTGTLLGNFWDAHAGYLLPKNSPGKTRFLQQYDTAILTPPLWTFILRSYSQNTPGKYE
jgi:hypothetical protein